MENEKAVAPIPSSASGRVAKLYVKEGDKISVGQSILAWKPMARSGNSPQPAAASAPARPHRPGRSRPQPVEAPSVDVVGELTRNESVAASPTVRRLAHELGIDLTRVRGSQRGGRIVVEDLRAYIQQITATGLQAKTVSARRQRLQRSQRRRRSILRNGGRLSRKPVSSLAQNHCPTDARIVGQCARVSRSLMRRTSPSIVALRKKYVAKYEKKGASLTLTPFLMRAVVTVLKKHPIFNSSLDEATDEIVFKDYYHMGIAVDTEQGLIVPVIRDVDKKSLLQLSKELAELAEKTRQRKVAADDLKGGHVHHFEPGRHRRRLLHADCEQARGGDPRRRARRAQTGCPRREDRETHAPAAGVVVRSPGH